MIKSTMKYSFEPDYAVAPGETLRETMEVSGMTQKELAMRTGLTVQSLNRIFKGEQPITYETANILELVFNVPASMWNNLEAQYRAQLAKVHERNRLEADLEWLKKIPVAKLIERELMPVFTDKVEQLRAVLSFFGVSSVNAWHQIWDEPAVAARRSACFESCPEAASAWIRQGEIQANTIACADFSKNKFKKAVLEIRKLTVLTPQEFTEKMRSLCAESGVALVFVPEIKKTPWYGATKWLSPKKAMIIINLRGKMEDLFWFSFFHEAGHVIHDSKKDLLINTGKNKQEDEREIRANEYAAELLIPAKFNERIRKLRLNKDIIDIAQLLEISPGIVVGRHQHLTGKYHNFKGLKSKFEWS
jgi:HTH-type transcriptional regulator/antitoxin HigA